MITLLLSLLTLASPSHADGPGRFASCAAMLERAATVEMSTYARWLLEDGLLRPTAQLETLLTRMTRSEEPDFVDDVMEWIGPAADVMPRMSARMRLSRQLTQLSLGYQALGARCARVSDALRQEHELVGAIIRRSEAILSGLQQYLRAHPGRDSDWVVDHIARVHQSIEQFRVGCFDNPPPQKKGALEALKRILWY